MTSCKNYVPLAAAVKQAIDNTSCHHSDAVACVQDLAYRLATVFADHDPQFDRARFLAACGLD